SIPQTLLFPWYHTAPPVDFIELLREPRFLPYLLVPQGNATLFEELRQGPWWPDRVPAFVLLDGTWSQSRKMLHRSPYLQGIPWMAIQPKTPSTYRLRCQRCAQHLSTVEVAIMLLEQLEEATACRVLQAYFRVFAERSMAARHGHPVTKALPEMAQLLAYNRHHTIPGLGECSLLGEGLSPE